MVHKVSPALNTLQGAACVNCFQLVTSCIAVSPGGRGFEPAGSRQSVRATRPTGAASLSGNFVAFSFSCSVPLIWPEQRTREAVLAVDFRDFKLLAKSQ